MMCPHYHWVVVRVHTFLCHQPSGDRKSASLLQGRNGSSDSPYGLHDTVQHRGDYLSFGVAESPGSPLSPHWHHINNGVGVSLYRLVQSRLLTWPLLMWVKPLFSLGCLARVELLFCLGRPSFSWIREQAFVGVFFVCDHWENDHR